MFTAARDGIEAIKKNRQKGARLGVSDALQGMFNYQPSQDFTYGNLNPYGMYSGEGGSSQNQPQGSGQMSGLGIDDDVQAAFMAGAQQNQPVNTGPASASIAFDRYAPPPQPTQDLAKRGDLQKTSRAAALGSALGTLGMNFMNLGYNPPALEPLSSPIISQIDEMDDNYLKAMDKYQNDLRGTEMANVGIANQERVFNKKAEDDAAALAAADARYKEGQIKDDARYQDSKEFRDKEFEARQKEAANQNWFRRQALDSSKGQPTDEVDQYAFDGLQSYIQEQNETIMQLRSNGQYDEAELLENQLKSYTNPDVLKNKEVTAKMSGIGRVQSVRNGTDMFIQSNGLNPYDPNDFEKIVKETTRLSQKAFGKDALSEDVIRVGLKETFKRNENIKQGNIYPNQGAATQRAAQPTNSAQEIAQMNAQRVYDGIGSGLIRKAKLNPNQVSDINAERNPVKRAEITLMLLKGLEKSKKETLGSEYDKAVKFLESYLKNPNKPDNINPPYLLVP